MGAVKQLWMDKIEGVCQDYCFNRLTLPEAISSLVRLGLDADEAETMLLEAVA